MCDNHTQSGGTFTRGFWQAQGGQRRVAPNLCRARGFTLVEIIMVIVITGIIGSMVAVFLKAPIQQYMDVSRRAELTDIADTALYRLASDISTAVPNSVRPVGMGLSYIEFLPTRDGGRYRANQDLSGASAVGDVLDFRMADGRFDIIGAPITFTVGDYLVLGSTQSGGVPAYDLSASGVLRAYTGAQSAAQSAVMMTATQYPTFAQLSSQRFDVVDGAQGAVTFACEGTLHALDASGNGQGQLVKHWAYPITAIQTVPAALAGSRALLATNVSACAIDYDTSSQRMGLLGVHLTISQGNESVSLYHEIHVNNIP